jgi:hypothetical protein
MPSSAAPVEELAAASTVEEPATDPINAVATPPPDVIFTGSMEAPEGSS